MRSVVETVHAISESRLNIPERATTVLGCFMEAIATYGVPSRVHSDCGDENVLVANYMLTHPERGTGRSFITGRSVHN